jgi:membrane-associated phospholipid phosphatase
VSWVKRRLEAAQPADIVFLVYVAFSGVVMAAFGWKLGPRIWIGITLVHVALLLVSLWFAGQPLRDRSVLGFLRDAYPIVFISYLYFELRYYALLFASDYHDPLILRIEETLFGSQLAMTFSQSLPYMWLSEIMHFFYATYWIMLPAALALLYARGRFDGFRKLIYAELVVFFGCYFVFIFFPVAGPHYQFPYISGDLADGFFYKAVHAVLEDGGSKGAAFPSSHVAVAIAIVLVTWRFDRLAFWAFLPFVAGLTISTVYGRFHYATDAASGVIAAFLLVALAGWLEPKLRRERAPGVGNSGMGSPV